MLKTLEVKMPGVVEMGRMELCHIEGGELTRKQEIWLERGIAFVLLGLVGVAIYELGRQNG